jgi:hypothetical protein
VERVLEKLGLRVEVQVELKVERELKVGLLWEISSWALELEIEGRQVLKPEIETMMFVPTVQLLEPQANSSFQKIKLR